VIDVPLSNGLIGIGALCGGGAVLSLRLAWGLPMRSARRNGMGWGLLLAGLGLGATGAGAWGVAAVTITATATAFLCLAYAGLRARPGKAVASNRRAHMLPEQREPLRIGGRLLSFVLIVPLAMLVALLAGLALRAGAVRLGAGEADGNILSLFGMPLIWALLVSALLLWPRRRRQWAVLGVPALLSALMLFLDRAVA
jgi:hypothetical protein